MLTAKSLEQMHPNENYTIIKTTTKEIIINPEQTRHIIEHKTCPEEKSRFTDKVHKRTKTYVTCSNTTFKFFLNDYAYVNSLFQTRNILLLALLSY